MIFLRNRVAIVCAVLYRLGWKGEMGDELSIIVSIAIYDSYDVYLWHLRGLSMALTSGNVATGQASFYHFYYSILVDNLNYAVFLPARKGL